MARIEVIIATVSISLLVVLLVSFYFMSWKKNSQEKFTRFSLSQEGPMKRSPVTTAFHGNGMKGNPHYVSNPRDELVPLEYGGVDFYGDQRKLHDGSLFAELDPEYDVGDNDAPLINDARTRADLINAGDIGLYRAAQNMPTSSHVRSYAAGPTEDDIERGMSFEGGLYHPSYHDDHIGN